MNIHEYQAKELFRSYNIPVSSGSVAYSAGEIERAVNEVVGQDSEVKTLIHAGGRGKGGGVKLARSLDEVKSISNDILGMHLVTPQTSAEGKLVHQVLLSLIHI